MSALVFLAGVFVGAGAAGIGFYAFVWRASRAFDRGQRKGVLSPADERRIHELVNGARRRDSQ